MFLESIITGYAIVALNMINILPLRNFVIKEPEISAKVALIWDYNNNKFLLEKGDINNPVPLASLSKLISSLVILDELDLDNVIEISPEAINTYGTAGGFKLGERVKVKDLLLSALMQSSNDAITALVEAIGSQKKFLDLMWKKTNALGFNYFRFSDPIGFSKENVGLPKEIIRLAKNAFDNEFTAYSLKLNKYNFESVSGFKHSIYNTNELIDNPNVIMAKTGFTEEAGQNYVVKVEIEGNPFIILLLNSQDRYRDALVLIQWLKNGFIWF